MWTKDMIRSVLDHSYRNFSVLRGAFFHDGDLYVMRSSLNMPYLLVYEATPGNGDGLKWRYAGDMRLDRFHELNKSACLKKVDLREYGYDNRGILPGDLDV